MTEARQLYTRLVARIRLALRDGEPGHAITAAINTLYRGLGWSLGKSRAAVAKDCGVTPRLWSEMLYGRDAPDDYHQQHDESPCASSPTATACPSCCCDRAGC